MWVHLIDRSTGEVSHHGYGSASTSGGPSIQPRPVAKRAEDPALEGGGEQRVRVGVWVGDDAGLAGPAGRSAGGAVARPTPPPSGADGHGAVPPSLRLAMLGPAIPCLPAMGSGQ